MASVNAPDTKDELTDRTVRSIDAATRAEIDPYREPGSKPRRRGLRAPESPLAA